MHDGEDATGRFVGRFCGSSTFRDGYFVTTQNHVFLWFSSDNSTAGEGFQLDWTTVDPGTRFFLL